MSREQVHIHPTAIVHPDAQIGPGTQVGPFSIIDKNVVVGRDCNIQEHVILRGHTQLGDEVKVFPCAVIGGEPQHLKYKGEPTSVKIGDRVILREGVTVHRGTALGKSTTVIGDDCLLMAYAHVAHDCIVGNNVIITNACLLGGHVVIEDQTVLGGLSAVAQFCRVGRYCYVGGGSILRKDLPPFLVGKGTDFQVQGVNIVGLTRRGFSSSTVSRLKTLFKIFYLQNLTVGKALEKISMEIGDFDEIKLFVDFVKSSKVGFIR